MDLIDCLAAEKIVRLKQKQNVVFIEYYVA